MPRAACWSSRFDPIAGDWRFEGWGAMPICGLEGRGMLAVGCGVGWSPL